MLGNNYLITNTEFFLCTSFNIILSSNIAVLIMWQYWWWSFFVVFFALYYLIIMNIIFTRYIKNNIIILGTLKSNGRWGDFVAVLIPMYWCFNILLNSNIILKILEWQTETHFCVLRIRGKQWYWVYKISIPSLLDMKKNTLIIGNNNKLSLNNNNNYFLNNFINKKNIKNINIKINNKKYYYNFLNTSKLINNIDYFIQLNKNIKNTFFILNNKKKLFFYKNSFFNFNKNEKPFLIFFEFSFKLKKNKTHYFTIQQQPKTTFFYNLNIKKFKLNLTSIKCKHNNEYRVFYTKNEKNIKNFFQSRNIFMKIYNNLYVFKNKNTFLIDFDKSINFKKYEKTVRLLEVNNILILPIKKNITIITNSFDVVHSWFVPGLGLKFDCVPGRATHHSLFIWRQGLYIGQCAEVCGRYHHHMPIKICSLNLDHFIYLYNTLYKNTFVINLK